MNIYYLLGTPDTKRKGLNTRNARNALTSKPSFIKLDNAVLIKLKNKVYFQIYICSTLTMLRKK